MEEKKYELTENKKELYGRTLYQIRALKDFNNVRKGDLGGWIEKESNLSQYGNCWVYDEAMVFDYAKVFDNAEIGGNAKVFSYAKVFGNANVYDSAKVSGYVKICDNVQLYSNAEIGGDAEVYGVAKIFDTLYNHLSNSYICMGPMGSRDDYTTAFLNKDKKILVANGCFKGTLKEFKKAVKEKHENCIYGKQYRRFIKYAKKYFKDILEIEEIYW